MKGPAVSTRRFLVSSLALAAAVSITACGVDPTTVDTSTDDVPTEEAPVGDQLVHPDTPVGDIGDDNDADPAADPGEPVSTPVHDLPGEIRPADGVEAPVEQVVTGRVVRVDRDGPSVEIVESSIVTGTEATDAARAAGAIGPDEEWTEEFFVREGGTRWVDIDPEATVAVYDCTQACEHVAGTLEHVLAGAPYGGPDALWTFVLGADGRASSVEELYTP